MEPINFEMSLGTLNQKYNRINNCKVVKPTYEIDGYYDNSFFLDKRDGLRKIIENSDRIFLDYKTVNGVDYVLSKNNSLLYLSTTIGNTLSDLINTSYNSLYFHDKLNLGFGLYGGGEGIDMTVSSVLGWGWRDEPPSIQDGKCIFGCNQTLLIGDQITFNSGILSGSSYDILNIDGVRYNGVYYGKVLPTSVTPGYFDVTYGNDISHSNDGYYFGTTGPNYKVGFTGYGYTELNTPGYYVIRHYSYPTTGGINPPDYLIFRIHPSADLTKRVGCNVYIEGVPGLPIAGDTFKKYTAGATSLGSTLLLSTGTSLLTYKINSQSSISLLSTKSFEVGVVILDVVNFSGCIFILTNRSLLFSSKTEMSNTTFDNLNFFVHTGGIKLLPCGKSMILFSYYNKVVSPISKSDGTEGFQMNDCNYNGDLYSRDSCIFADQTIYLLQKDKQLKKIDITQYGVDSFDLTVNNVLENTIGLFNGLSAGGTVSITHSQRMLNFIYNNGSDNNTTIYQYDKMYKHFIENTYSYKINIFDRLILANGFIFTESGLTDNGNEYEQVITFMIDTKTQIYKPYIIRTLFGMLDTKIDLSLSITSELGGKLTKQVKTLNNFLIDKRLTTELTGDDIIGGDTVPLDNNEYNGTTVSIQSNILQVGRFIKFKYNSYNRFCIGDSYVITDSSKAFINEPLLTN